MAGSSFEYLLEMLEGKMHSLVRLRHRFRELRGIAEVGDAESWEALCRVLRFSQGRVCLYTPRPIGGTGYWLFDVLRRPQCCLLLAALGAREEARRRTFFETWIRHSESGRRE